MNNCSRCQGHLGNRYFIRNNKKYCARHFVEGMKKGDKLILNNKHIATFTDDKVENYQLLMGNY